MPVDLPPIPRPDPQNTTSSTGPGSAAWRDRHAIIGGFAQQQPSRYIGGLSPASAIAAPGFDPYRGGDLRRILQNQVNAGTLADLQQTLIDVGLIDANDVLFGYADDGTTAAFTTLLGIANQQGMDWRDVLSMAAQGGGGALASAGVGLPEPLAPTIITLPNRDDVVAGLAETGLALTGQQLDDDLHQTAADAVLDALRTQQERQFRAEQDATPGGLMFAAGAPDPARLMEEEIREQAPDEVMGRGAQDAVNTLLGTLAGPI
jgi:hypothetical protein